MRAHAAPALLALTVLAGAAAAQGYDPAAVAVGAGPPAGDGMPPVAAVIGDVTVLPDITYATLTGFRPLALDLYRAPGNGPAPLVVFVHGGGWTVGNKRQTGHFESWPAVLAGIAAQGIHVAAIEYRLSGEARFPGAVHDVKAAVRFLRAHADDYGIDPARIALWGGSAGANLAATAALTCDEPGLAPAALPAALAGVSDCVAALVGWYGPYDLAPMLGPVLPLLANVPADPSPAETETLGSLAFFGCTATGCPPETIAAGSPIRHADEGDPPTLLLQGTEDAMVDAAQATAMAAALAAAGVDVEVAMIEGVGHGWVRPGDQPATARGSREALALTVDFLVRTLAPGAPE